jgi:uncharacterized membrane protein YdjX (TVP38/TMEM64 family)
MKHYWFLILSMVIVILALFAMGVALNLPLLENPHAWMSSGGAGAALLGIGLLIADVVLPVPASLIMMANGAIFGVLAGTFFSVVGLLGAGMFGFGLGRWGGRWLERLVPASERARGNAFLDRWGDLAIVITRPIPILAEVISILAGTSPMRWGRMMVSTLLGSAASALPYCIMGATAANLDSPFLAVSLAFLVAGIFWLVSRTLRGGSA